jgi:hypothetical protein
MRWLSPQSWLTCKGKGRSTACCWCCPDAARRGRRNGVGGIGHAALPAVLGPQPGRACAPGSGGAASRRGMAPTICMAIRRGRPASGSALGATKRSPAAIASSTDARAHQRDAAVIEVSAGRAAVQASAATWPGGVIAPRSKWLAGQDRAVLGPAQGDRHRLGVLDADDRGARLERLPALGRQVLVGLSGFSRSMKRS